MATEKEKWIEEIENLRGYLPMKKRKELAKILAYWEWLKKEWKKMEEEFWKKHDEYRKKYDKEYWYKLVREDFLNLISQYEESKQEFKKWLSEKGVKILEKLEWIKKEKFYKEYLNEIILYLGNPKKNSYKREYIHFYGEVDEIEILETKPWMEINIRNYESLTEQTKIIAEKLKNRLQPWMKIDLWENNIWDEWAKIIAKKRKHSLQPWMKIDLWENNIWDDWVKSIAENWKNNLQPWMEIFLWRNAIWNDWVKSIAENRKNNLQPWMIIYLKWNEIRDDWVREMVENWKNSLKPWMKIDLRTNKIWDIWVQAIMDNLELKDRVLIDLRENNITKKKKEELKAWIKSKQEEWIKCEILVD